MARNRRRKAPKPSPREEEMVVFAPTGEPKVDPEIRINQSRVRLPSSLRRMKKPEV